MRVLMLMESKVFLVTYFVMKEGNIFLGKKLFNKHCTQILSLILKTTQ